jgi:hypothetical protein
LAAFAEWLAAFADGLAALRPRVLPKSPLGAAVTYMTEALVMFPFPHERGTSVPRAERGLGGELGGLTSPARGETKSPQPL